MIHREYLGLIYQGVIHLACIPRQPKTVLKPALGPYIRRGTPPALRKEGGFRAILFWGGPIPSSAAGVGPLSSN
jgi:hypothetical protein